jgi:HPt (histidine-containing phosphotransfer) domain-containing protein
MSDQASAQEQARQAAIREALLELQAEYAEALPGLIADLTDAGEAACASGDAVQLRHFQTLAHRIHGGGGSYGFKAVSKAAGHLEEALAEHEANEEPLDDRVRAAFLAALRDVCAAADAELASFAQAAAASNREVFGGSSSGTE